MTTAGLATCAPRPVFLALVLGGLLVYCMRLLLNHRRAMEMIKKTPRDRMPELARSINGHRVPGRKERGADEVPADFITRTGPEVL